MTEPPSPANAAVRAVVRAARQVVEADRAQNDLGLNEEAYERAWMQYAEAFVALTEAVDALDAVRSSRRDGVRT